MIPNPECVRFARRSPRSPSSAHLHRPPGRRQWPVGLLVLALAWIGGGCGTAPDGPAGSAVVDTLPNGAVLVTNGPPGDFEQDTGWVLREELRIGRAEGTGPDVFGAIQALAVDGEGRIYVLEPQAREVRVFGRDGSHLRTMGRRGEGPGELQNPMGLAAHPDGSLWVADPGNARYTVFDSAGALIATHPRPFSFFMLPWPGGFDSAGRFHDVGAGADGVFLARLSDGIVGADTFPIPEDGMPRLRVVNAEGMPVMSIVPPFAPRLHWALDAGGFVWTGASDSVRFVRHTLAGDTVRIVRQSREPVPVTRAEADSIREWTEEMIGNWAGAGARLEGELSVPAHKPAFQWFTVGLDGGIWVEPYLGRGESRRLEAFDAEGVFRGSLDVDPRLLLVPATPVIAADVIHAVVTDEMDVPYVVRYRTRER